MSEAPSSFTAPARSLGQVIVSALIAGGLYGLIGLVLAALTALGTDGFKLTLIASVAGFGAAMTLGAARHLRLGAVLAAGAALIAGFHALARIGDALIPFTTFHPLSGAAAAAVCFVLIYALRRQRPSGGARSSAPKGEADA